MSNPSPDPTLTAGSTEAPGGWINCVDCGARLDPKKAVGFDDKKLCIDCAVDGIGKALEVAGSIAARLRGET